MVTLNQEDGKIEHKVFFDKEKNHEFDNHEVTGTKREFKHIKNTDPLDSDEDLETII